MGQTQTAFADELKKLFCCYDLLSSIHEIKVSMETKIVIDGATVGKN
jgi:hypothetical protein